MRCSARSLATHQQRQPWKTAVLVRVLNGQFCRPQPSRTGKDTPPMSPIRAVWFDVGEVLINETREYGTWADWLGTNLISCRSTYGI
jgi:hypothetical protein